MASKRYLIANWKMNLPQDGIGPYLKAVGGARIDGVNVVIAPPFPYLREVASQTSLGVAAQNCSDHEKGAFTGEVSPAMVRETGARFVIVGHSERRTLCGESDVVVARKLALAMKTGLTPVLCIGEELRVRDAGQVATFLAGQIRAAADAGLENRGEVILAYEPVWAIGTGRNASGLMVAETVAHIREALARFWPEQHQQTSILYGGSVTPENVQDLETSGRVDGYLVGGASLDSGKFLSLLRAMQRER